MIPPTIIFDAKKMNHAWTGGELPGTKYGCSESGWITTDLFESWLTDHFLIHAVGARPLLLLLDGHSTHYQPRVVQDARKKGVVMLCLLPHTTHDAQPFDCGVFSPLKAQWRSVCHQFLQTNPGKIITKFNFTSLFSKAWLQAVTPGNVMAGFKTCGVYPFNPKAIQVSNNDNSEVVASEVNADKDNSDNIVENDKGEVEQSFDNIVENDTDKVVHEQPSPNVNFTAEQQQLFKRRFEEGYNIFIDPDYVRWLRLHHPESCPADGSDCALNNDSVISHFPDVVTPSPVAIVSMDELISQLDTSELAASVLSTEDVTEIPVPFPSPSSGSSTVSLSSIPCLSTSSTPSTIPSSTPSIVLHH